MAPSVVVNFNPHIVIATIPIFSQLIFYQKRSPFMNIYGTVFSRLMMLVAD